MAPHLQKLLRGVRRRLALQRFLAALPWCLAAAFLVGAVAVGIDKWRPYGAEPWNVAGIAAAAGLALALVQAWRRRGVATDAALELDRACGLQERVSTLMTLPAELRDAPAAQALAADVQARTQAVALGERLPVQWPRRAWLPAAPLGLLFGAALLSPFAVAPVAAAKKPVAAAEQELAKANIEKVREKIAALAQEKKDKKGPVDAGLKELELQLEKLSKDLGKDKTLSPQDAALKLADFSKSIAEKQKQFNNLDRTKQALAKLPKMNGGPAEKLAQALKEGDFSKALDQVKKLQERAADPNATKDQKKEVAKQLQQLQKQLKDAANLEKRKEELTANIKDKAQLQKALQKLAQDAKELQQLQKLAEKMQKVADAMEKQQQQQQAQGGKPGEKGQQKQDMAAGQQELDNAVKEAMKELEAMAGEEGSRRMMNEMMDELAEARGGMMNQNGMPDLKPSPTDRRRQPGQVGTGRREEAPDETKGRLAKAETKQVKGKLTVTGLADGKNFRGASRLEMKEMAPEAVKAAQESVTRQRVPRDYKQHTQDYFDTLNKGL